MPILENPDENHSKPFIVKFYRPNGKRARLLEPDRIAAERTLVKERGPKSRDDLVEVSVATAVETWLAALPKKGNKQRTLIEVRRLVNTLLVKPYGSKACGKLSVADFHAIQDGMTARKLTEFTKYSQCKLLEQFCVFAKKEGFSHTNAAAIANIAVPAPDPLSRPPFYPSPVDRRAIRMASSPLVLASVDCALEAGGTVSEIGRLRRDDANFDAMTIKWRGIPTHIDPEGDVLSRTVAMTPLLAASLLRHLLFLPPGPPTIYMFPNTTGEQLHYTAMGQMLRNTQLAFGMSIKQGQKNGRGGKPEKRSALDKRVSPIAKYDFDSLRHYAAVKWAADNGLRSLGDFLGLEVRRVETVYGDLYDKARAFEWVLANRNKRP